ncbi:MAG: SWIM zinc finger family protein [Caldilineaceae bacterium]
MNDKLTQLSEADISSRCTAESFARGRGYYAGGAVRQRLRHADSIEARVAGTYTYRVTIRERAGELAAFCTCPYDWGGDCKHIVATLLAWLHEPESFRAATALQDALAARSQEELAAILTDICTVYPHLVDEFGLLGEAATYDPASVIDTIFADLEPPGEIDVDEGVARMETVARHAARLAQQDQGDLARQTYAMLTVHCVNFCETYGAHDIFPPNIPYDFADAYRDLALDQIDDHANAIEREVREILQGDWAPEMLGIQEPLLEVWDVLGL